MRKEWLLAALSAIAILLPPKVSALEIQMRLSSGLWRMNLDEINAALTGWQEGLKREVDVDPNAQFIGGEVGRLRLGTEFEAEILLAFSRWFKLGLSAGYVFGAFNEKDSLLTIEQAGTLQNQARPTEVSAYPFLASGYFNLPLGKKINAYLRVGVGGIQAGYISREAIKKVGDTKFSYPVYDNAGGHGMIYLGGLGLSYSFDQSLGFFVEAAARFARVKELTGKDPLEQEGKLYSYEEYLAEAGFWRPTMHVLSEEPGSANVRNIRATEVDFSGYSIKIGLLLKL